MEQYATDQIEQVYRIMHQQAMKLQEIETQYVLFTWRWWLLLALAIVPWIIWIWVRKRDSTDRLLYAAMFVALIGSFLNVMGIAYGLWSYPASLIFPVPPNIPWDFTLLPVATMLFLQYKPKVKPIIKAIIFSFIGSFFWQPFAEFTRIYHPIHWPDYYSFPIFIMIFLMANYVYSRNNFAK